MWGVEDRDGGRFETGTGKDGKKRAKALAAALDAAGFLDLDELPPVAEGSERPTRFGDSDGWEEWTAESYAVPAKAAVDGKYSMAGFMHGVHHASPSEIARYLDVSEQSVRQYLSDLRAGRRSE